MRGLQLYVIKNEYDALMAQAEDYAAENEGVIPDDLSDRLDEIGECYQEKMENCGLIVKNCLVEAEAIRNEEKALAARRKSLENRAEWLKNYMSDNMDVGETFETPKVKVSFRRSESVEITNADAVPDDYCKITREVSKAAIKAAIKAGSAVSGAQMVEKYNIQIK